MDQCSIHREHHSLSVWRNNEDITSSCGVVTSEGRGGEGEGESGREREELGQSPSLVDVCAKQTISITTSNSHHDAR